MRAFSRQTLRLLFFFTPLACGGTVTLGALPDGDTAHDAGPGSSDTRPTPEAGPIFSRHDASPPTGDARTSVDGPTTPSSEAGPTTSSEASTVTGASDQLVAPTLALFPDGDIVADDANVYWVQQGSNGGEIFSCPVAGCADGTPTAFWSGSDWGWGIGDLALGGGSLFFQGAGTDENPNGSIMRCSTAGCGDSLVTVAASAGDTVFSPGLTTDATNVYWADTAGIHAAPLVGAINTPTLLTSIESGAEVVQLAASGGSVYWVDITKNSVMSVPATGGAASVACVIPGAASIAIAGNVAYVGGAREFPGGVGGVYACPLPSGTATLFAADDGAADVAVNGTNVFWFSQPGGESVVVRACPLGGPCSSFSSLAGPILSSDDVSYGFAVNSTSVFWIGNGAAQGATGAAGVYRAAQ